MRQCTIQDLNQLLARVHDLANLKSLERRKSSMGRIIVVITAESGNTTLWSWDDHEECFSFAGETSPHSPEWAAIFGGGA